ncbi:hypothetical protein F4814DRAFT_461082 [Daldinia grandis]|nr:hypothetical protein F4814DRAFT_461082 [Daldinia grandis]
MNVKVITNKSGSILGKIPVRMSETPNHENTRSVESSTNYRSYLWAGSPTGPRRSNDRAQTQTRGVQTEDNQRPERAQPTRQRTNPDGGPGERRENDTEMPRNHDGALPLSRGGYWFRGSSIRSLVKSFLGMHMPEEIANRGRIQFSEEESFFPDPMITFLVDRPANLVCQICKTVTLSVGPLAQTPYDSTPAILPCGHLACHNCLKAWVDTNRTCPFCRKEMRYSGCGHTLKPALITHDIITTLPKTLSRGGKIGESCRECQDRENKDKALIMWGMAAEAIRSSRDFPAEIDPEYAQDMSEVTRAFFENIPQFSVNMVRGRDTW